MITFIDYLNETGNSPMVINWVKNSSEWKGTFTVNSKSTQQEFEIVISKLEECNGVDIIQFKFFKDNSTKQSNDNKYMWGVLSTVKKALYDYIEEMSPSMLLFASSDNSNFRKAIYKLESAKLATKFDYYDVSKLDGVQDADVLFGIYKNKEYLMCLENLIGIKLR